MLRSVVAAALIANSAAASRKGSLPGIWPRLLPILATHMTMTTFKCTLIRLHPGEAEEVLVILDVVFIKKVVVNYGNFIFSFTVLKHDRGA